MFKNCLLHGKPLVRGGKCNLCFKMIDTAKKAGIKANKVIKSSTLKQEKFLWKLKNVQNVEE